MQKGLARGAGKANGRPRFDRGHGPSSAPDMRRGGREVECAALEMQCTGNSTVGSNPTLSAINESCGDALLQLCFCRPWGDFILDRRRVRLLAGDARDQGVRGLGVSIKFRIIDAPADLGEPDAEGPKIAMHDRTARQTQLICELESYAVPDDLSTRVAAGVGLL